jgi:hypothetical protein
MRTGYGLDTDMDMDLSLDILGGHGAAIARLFCGHFADTESFIDEGVGRALG